MIDQTRIYYFIFGALTIAGGLMGFIKKHSTESLISGGLGGILLLIAGILLRDKPQQGLMVGGVVSLVLAGWAIYNFFPKHKMMPHGMIFVLGLIGIVMTLVSYSKR